MICLRGKTKNISLKNLYGKLMIQIRNRIFNRLERERGRTGRKDEEDREETKEKERRGGEEPA